ncbi:MAG: pyridoxal phosphate-dependent aminotransferase [Acidobacteriaceae bacterium]|nr:pyridoxal phosphate-dependent aminotransferase [Acidobacteriaceae bacterium]
MSFFPASRTGSPSVSRRNFMRFASMVAAGTALPFADPFTERTLAQIPTLKHAPPPDAVLINLNENPMGPAPEALEAAYAATRNGGRYQDIQHAHLKQALADREGLKPDYVQEFAGSSDALLRIVLAFTSPSRPLIVGDPTFEAAEKTARLAGAPVIRVPLTKTYAFDVKAMVAASPNAGLYYIVSPNNPTGTVTPLADVKWLLENKPKGSIVLLDEAYIHIAKDGGEPASGLVAADKDIIVLRTFSKIYGLAGLRAGAAFARPDLLDKIRIYSSFLMPASGMAAAVASLNSKGLVEQRRTTITNIREDVLSFLEKQNTPYIPNSQANCFMFDAKRPGGEVIEALQEQKVYVGRAWPIYPTYVRVTVGTKEDMEKFKAAFVKVTT